VDDDLWMDAMPEGDDIGLLFEDGLLAAMSSGGEASIDVGGGYYGYTGWDDYQKRRKKQADAIRLDILAQNRIAIAAERNRQKDIALVRDRNLEKAQAVQAIPKRREEGIAATRMDNLQKAWRVQKEQKKQ
jgi:hypothetical protein